MYLKYAQKKWKAQVVQLKEGKEAGLKNVTLIVEGDYAYGFLRKETGVHRLVRLSPFNSDNLRHTSFALVEVMPEFTEDKELKIDSNNLKIETYKASGPGGQYVNKTESAIRITHVPTNITAACQSERLQGENKKKAMKLLYSKLYKYYQAGKEAEREKLRGNISSAEWGSQIRSYVLHPYQMVKDHRTGVKTGNVKAILEDGRLKKFIEAEITSNI